MHSESHGAPAIKSGRHAQRAGDAEDDRPGDGRRDTVKTHVRRILGKLDARDRTQAVIRAYESGFVTPG